MSNLGRNIRREGVGRTGSTCTLNGWRTPPSFSQSGLTLVELMVALTISLMILAVISFVFVSGRSTYVREEGMARTQESGRFGVEFLSSDIRMAGYAGCLPKSALSSGVFKNNLNSPTSFAANFAPGQFVYGYRYVGSGGTDPASDWTPILPSGLFGSNDLAPYSDVLVVRHAADTSAFVGAAMADTSADVSIYGNPGGLAKLDIVLVADCKHADLFQITDPAAFDTDVANLNNLAHTDGAVASGPGNGADALNSTYGPKAEVMKLITRVYYVGKRNTDSATPPSLFRKEMIKGVFTAQELLEGVESLALVFGVDTDTDKVANRYYGADTLPSASWPNVVSVRYALLTRTPSTVETTDDTQNFSIFPDVFGAAAPPTSDRFRRQVFYSTVQLRNP